MDIGALIGTVTGIGGAGFGVWTKVIKPFMRKERVKKDEYYRKLNEIHSELRFNGGSSIKDAIFELKETTKNIEFRLDGIEENQKLVMNLQGISYWISDECGECTYASPAVCKLLGRSESELLGNGWMAWIHPEDKERVVESWQFSVENKTAFDEIYKIKKSDNSFIMVWAVAFPKSSKSKTLGGVLGKLVPMEEPATSKN